MGISGWEYGRALLRESGDSANFRESRHNLEISWILQKPFQSFSGVPQNDRVAISWCPRRLAQWSPSFEVVVPTIETN